MSEPVKPAMTPRQWGAVDELSRDGSLTEQLGHACSEIGFWGLPQEEEVGRHGLAALCLYGKPYGFTDADTHSLREAIRVWRREFRIPDGAQHGHLMILQLEGLVERIAALIPPEENLVNVTQISGVSPHPEASR